MSYYEISPETIIKGYDIPTYKNLNASLKKCRKLCDDMGDCQSFVWNPESNTGGCSLKKYATGGEWDPTGNNFLYVKKNQKGKWWLWTGIIILILLFFMRSCKG